MALSQKIMDIAIASSINAMTKYIINRDGLDEETAYKKLLDMEIYKLMIDQDSGIWKEFENYLCDCCEVEFAHGVAALYNFFKDT